MRFLCFDLCSTRSTRLQTDKFGLISDVWNRFVNNSISHYKPGENITIDEQLSLTKSHCRYTQYIPNKPDKFCIKFWLADVESKYILNSIPNLGKDGSRPSTQMLRENIVTTLMEPFALVQNLLQLIMGNAETLQLIAFSRRFHLPKS